MLFLCSCGESKEIIDSTSDVTDTDDFGPEIEMFKQLCAACHSIDKKIVGPSLACISENKERDWLHAWIGNSDELIKSGDVDAIAIWQEYNETSCIAQPQLIPEDKDAIISYLDSFCE